MTFMNLPNQVPAPNDNNLTGEADKYYSLYNNLNRTKDGQEVFESASSGKRYSTSNYSTDSDVFNKGQTGMMNLLYKYVLKPYIVMADSINDLITKSENNIVDGVMTYDTNAGYVLTLDYEPNKSIYTIRFRTPNDYISGRKILLNNVVYNPILSGSSETMPNNTFLRNRIITANVDKTNKTITFNSSSSASFVKQTSTPPVANQNILWIHTGDRTLRYSNGSSWIKISGVWG